MRAGRPGTWGSTVRDEERQPVGPSNPRQRARWFFRSPVRAVLIIALAIGVVVAVTPADGAAGDIASSFARVVGHLTSPSQDGQDFACTPAVGALFTTNQGKLSQHFCTASVVSSPTGVAILMISSDMEEVIGVSDRIVVMQEGAISGTLNRDQFSEENVMRLAVARGPEQSAA